MNILERHYEILTTLYIAVRYVTSSSFVDNYSQMIFVLLMGLTLFRWFYELSRRTLLYQVSVSEIAAWSVVNAHIYTMNVAYINNEVIGLSALLCIFLVFRSKICPHHVDQKTEQLLVIEALFEEQVKLLALLEEFQTSFKTMRETRNNIDTESQEPDE